MLCVCCSLEVWGGGVKPPMQRVLGRALVWGKVAKTPGKFAYFVIQVSSRFRRTKTRMVRMQCFYFPIWKIAQKSFLVKKDVTSELQMSQITQNC